jgi:hypothetical protein
MYDVDAVDEMVHEKHHVFSVNLCEKIRISPDARTWTGGWSVERIQSPPCCLRGLTWYMDKDWWMECGEDTQSPMLPDRTDLVHGQGLVDGVWRGYTFPHVA